MQHKDAFDMVPSGAPTTRGSAKQKAVAVSMPHYHNGGLGKKRMQGRYCQCCLQFRPLGAFDEREAWCRACKGLPKRRAMTLMAAQIMEEGKK